MESWRATLQQSPKERNYFVKEQRLNWRFSKRYCKVSSQLSRSEQEDDRRLFGVYFSSSSHPREEDSVPVLDEFVNEMAFHRMSFDVALRRFLLKFRLPGEAQKIDRMMERFAQQYFNHNLETASLFSSSGDPNPSLISRYCVSPRVRNNHVEHRRSQCSN